MSTQRALEAADTGTLAGFRSDNIRGFGRALGLSVQAVRQLVAATPDQVPEDDSYSPAATVRLFNESFTGDPDFDDPEDLQAGREEWLNRMIGGLLPPGKSHNFRRLDLTLMEFYGQGLYDPADPRHPLRWFDRDDLRDRCESEIAHIRLPQEARNARAAEALNRV